MSSPKRRLDAEGAAGAQGPSGRRPRRLKSGVQRIARGSVGRKATALDRYLRDMAHETLSRDEELALARRLRRAAQAGESSAADEARHELAEHNLRLVVAVAKRYVGLGVPLGDLIQEGNIGLLEAVERFDPERGTRFSTYAVWWIKQAIHRGLSSQGRTIVIPQHVRMKMVAIDRAARELATSLGREPSTEELAEAVGLTVKALVRHQGARLGIQPLDAPSGDDDDLPLAETYSNHRLSSEVVTSRLEERRLAQELLEVLGPRERRVLRLRLGFEDGRPRALREIGLELGLSAERVRQIEASALSRLRAISVVDPGDDGE